MENNQQSSLNSLGKEQGEVKKFKAQMKRVFAALYKQPKTMLLVSIETGILRANICRYIAEWKKENNIKQAFKGNCPISKHKAVFYTTNPDLIKQIVNPLNTVKP